MDDAHKATGVVKCLEDIIVDAEGEHAAMALAEKSYIRPHPTAPAKQSGKDTVLVQQ